MNDHRDNTPDKAVILLVPENNDWQPIATFPPDKYDHKVEVGWWNFGRWVSFIAYQQRDGLWWCGGIALGTPDWWRERTPPPMPPGVK